MKKLSWKRLSILGLGTLMMGALLIFNVSQSSAKGGQSPLPSHQQVRAALQAIVAGGGNGGAGFNMWATIVDRDGQVAVVAFSGNKRGDQFPGSRVISAVKANAANSFSVPNLALSSGNLYSVVQPGSQAFGLETTNPVNASVAYKGNPRKYGQRNDPAVGKRLGGVTGIAGGLAIYDRNGVAIGGLGVSGETNVCADHAIAWKLRDALGLDTIPGGLSPTGDDNLIFDLTNGVSASGFGHPECDPVSTQIVRNLPTTHPVGP